MVNKKRLQQFDSCLITFCKSIYGLYNKPLPLNEVDYYMQRLGLINEDFKQIYSWKNGINAEPDYRGDRSINMAGNFMSLEDCLFMDNINSTNKYWRNSLKPFITNDEGEYLLLESDTQNSPGYIYLYSSNLSYAIEPISIYDNLEAMLISIEVLFTEGAQWYDKESGLFDFDVEATERICKKVNPNSERWK